MNHVPDSEDRALVFLPTFNERENVGTLCSEILGLGLNADILFMDDASPDGTGEVLDRLAAEHPNVRVIHRPRKLGIGSAHRDGINWAYDHEYSTLVTMDCDFAHRPEHLSELLSRSRDSDVVVGSRYLRQGSLDEWVLYRKVLAALAHLLTKSLLRIRYDATGAFRAYRLDRIPRETFGLVQSSSYSFFFESLVVLQVNGHRIEEVPIKVAARTFGRSKMRVTDAIGSITRLLRVFLALYLRPSRYRLPEGGALREETPRSIKHRPLDD
jgi:dolichol-phosphate mannosyltransferase